jgi:superoxide dismutase
MEFISLTNYELHREHLRQLRLKASIFEKSYPEITGKSCKEILKLPIKRQERKAAAALFADVNAHELYFSSFSQSNPHSQKVQAAFGSEANFIYRLTREAECCRGFLFVSIDRRGTPVISAFDEPILAFLSDNTPILAVDLCEHAYFYDYFFNRDAYLRAALSRLDLSKIK